MICSNIEELIKQARSFSWWGRDCYCVGSANLLPKGTCNCRFSQWLRPDYNGIIDHKYFFTNIGYNLKPLDLQGAIGDVQLKKFDEIHERRKISHDTITDILLRNIKGLRIPKIHNKSEVAWFGTPFICETRELKESLVPFLEKNKIQTRNYFAGNILLPSL